MLLSNFFKYNEMTPEKSKIVQKLRRIAIASKIVANIYFKNDKQVYNILNKIEKQSYKPTHILIHVNDKELKNSIDLSAYKDLRITYYCDTNVPNYPGNVLVRVNDLKYKIRLDEYTNYDDQFIKTLIIEEAFK